MFLCFSSRQLGRVGRVVWLQSEVWSRCPGETEDLRQSQASQWRTWLWWTRSTEEVLHQCVSRSRWSVVSLEQLVFLLHWLSPVQETQLQWPHSHQWWSLLSWQGYCEQELHWSNVSTIRVASPPPVSWQWCFRSELSAANLRPHSLHWSGGGLPRVRPGHLHHHQTTQTQEVSTHWIQPHINRWLLLENHDSLCVQPPTTLCLFPT